MTVVVLASAWESCETATWRVAATAVAAADPADPVAAAVPAAAAAPAVVPDLSRPYVRWLLNQLHQSMTDRVGPELIARMISTAGLVSFVVVRSTGMSSNANA